MFQLDQALIEEAVLAVRDVVKGADQQMSAHIVSIAVQEAIARQLNKIVEMPGATLSARLDALLEFVPSDNAPAEPKPVRKSRRS